MGFFNPLQSLANNPYNNPKTNGIIWIGLYFIPYKDNRLSDFTMNSPHTQTPMGFALSFPLLMQS